MKLTRIAVAAAILAALSACTRLPTGPTGTGAPDQPRTDESTQHGSGG